MPRTDSAIARRASATTTAALLAAPSEAAIQPRVFFNMRQTPGKTVEPLDLGEIRDLVIRQTALQAPRDIQRTPSQMSIRWSPDNNRATLHVLAGLPEWVGGDVAEDGGLVFTRTGLKSYLREILPNRGAGFLDALVAADRKGGAKLATLNAALLSRPLDSKPLQLRTVRTTDPATGKVVRAVRGVFRNHTAFDDADYLRALCECPDTRNLPVLSFMRSDDALRLRFALAPVESIEVNRPIGMVEGWNSETGGGRRRSVGLAGGTWTSICTNGMARWERGAAWTWAHTGRRSRISDGLPQAVAEVRAKADGLVDAYNSAIDVAIDDAAAWLAAQLSREGVAEATAAAIVGNLDHEVVTPGRMLTSTIDAITWTAQAEIDAYRQNDLEGAAVRILARGVNEAARSDDRILRAPLDPSAAPAEA
jgi:hypothetical protein